MRGFHDNRQVFEKLETTDYFIPGIPVIIRCDGRSFHTFTRGFDRPYDKDMSSVMQLVCKQIVEEKLPCIGYTQSDEMTFVFMWDSLEQMPWGGRKFKLIGDLATSVTNKFNYCIMSGMLGKRKITKHEEMIQFDCRAYSVPSKREAVLQLIDREQDATKNSIAMAAQSYFSHNALYKKNGNEMQEMLFQKGINWNDYPNFFKRGTYFRRVRVETPFTTDEIENLPEQHNARKNPKLIIARWIIEETNMILDRVINSREVVFSGAQPEPYVKGTEVNDNHSSSRGQVS